MNKLMIVGHPTSDYQDVEALLIECGMTKALPSRRERLTPVEISSMLLKAHSSAEQSAFERVRNLPQVEAGPIWHGMALDLMLGNIEQKLWGWADPHALQLLDYWKKLDPSIAFVLVYDSPESLLVRSSDAGLQLEGLQGCIREWCSYNEALLHFFYRNSERSLLVHAQQVRASASGYLQQVRARISAPVGSILEVPRDRILINEARHDAAIWGDASGKVLPSARPAGAIKRFLAKTLISDKPEVAQLFEELQTAANLPLVTSADGSEAVHRAWLELLSIEQSEATYQVELKRQETEFVRRIEDLQGSIGNLHSKLANAERENLIKLQKLHEVQEQSECYRNELLEEAGKVFKLGQYQSLAEDRKKEIAKLEQQILEKEALASTAQQKLSVLVERSTQDSAHILQLEKDVSALTKEAAKSRVQRHDMETALLHAQEELERSHIELQKALEKSSPSSEERIGTDEHLKRLSLQKAEADKRAAQLDLVRLDLEKRNGRLQSEVSALVERIHRMQEEWEGRLLASPANVTKLPEHYGAAERVRRQLSYRLGATMIKHSYSVGGWLSMPLGLAKEAKRFRNEKKYRSKEKLPPIASYRDAHEADRMRRHLSYRLGAKMLGNAGSPLGWVRMPFILRREVNAFREERSKK
ncbi:putative Chromosome segregation ATPases-like protein [Cupriavidus taiwanensis]|uniref:Chromosome segregation ATPases-like protein n=1 Tax=Cupriavidus taiwanensis TaxID=164546 RepID=A0A975XAY7_9BURK|nr:hypothetical protein [Cupriavidus taiwanensis]SOY64179.1 putative Chromosome segregation ATPases-like protein [Cupriavidus taiwanensis]